MADISKGPDQLSRLLSRIEDGSAHVMPGDAQPNALERSSEMLAQVHAAVREAAQATRKPAKGKLTLTIEVTAGPGNGEASPCEHAVAFTVALPKRPKLTRPAWVDDEGNVLGSEPRQLELTAVSGGEKAAPKASRKVV
jgi:hypothetical protein